MKQLTDRLLANNLVDLEGLEIKGMIPLKETLVNELIAAYMDDFFTNTPPPERDIAVGSAFIKVFKKLKPEQFNISFETGKAVVHIELKR